MPGLCLPPGAIFEGYGRRGNQRSTRSRRRRFWNQLEVNVKKWAARSAIVLGMVAASACLLECASKSKTSTSSQTGDSGSLGLQLQIGDVMVDSVHYVLSNGTVNLSGDIAVSGATALSFVIG